MTPTELMFHQARDQHRRAMQVGLVVTTRRMDPPRPSCEDDTDVALAIVDEPGADVVRIDRGRP